MIFGSARKCGLLYRVGKPPGLFRSSPLSRGRWICVRQSSDSGEERKNLGHKFLAQDLMHKKVRWGRVCITAPRRSEFKCQPQAPPVGHWTGQPECRSNPCVNIYPLFDEIYYKTSDKDKRKYQQTWTECPNIVIEEAPVCCFQSFDAIPMKKRTIEEIRVLTNFKASSSVKCNIKPNTKCVKIRLPGCKEPRLRTDCFPTMIPKVCNKCKCPYPSFSECVHPRIKEGLHRECTCWKFDGMCEVWAALRREELYKK